MKEQSEVLQGKVLDIANGQHSDQVELIHEQGQTIKELKEEI